MNAHYALLFDSIQKGKWLEVERQSQALLTSNPEDPELWHFLGIASYQLQSYDHARAAFRQALALNDREANYHNNLGLTLQALGSFREAAAAIRRALQLRPQVPAFLSNLANLLNLLDDYHGAEALARAALYLAPEHVDAHISLGAAMSYQGQSDRAVIHFRRAIELAPEHVEAHRNLAHTLVELGRFDEAREMYGFCLQHDPTDGDAVYGLSTMKSYRGEDFAEIDYVRRLAQRPELNPATRSDLHLAVGKMLDDCGRYDEAYAHFTRARDLPHQAFDVHSLRRRMEGWTDHFPPDRWTSGPETTTSELPIFILGMPRSGSTLVEQILASHPQVVAGGELPDMRLIIGGEWSRPPRRPVVPAELDLVTLDDRRAWAQWYLNRRRVLAGDALRVTDKMPVNFLYLGLITWLFPRARIIHIHRDPFDCGLSIFAQRFIRKPDYWYSQADIGAFIGEYEGWMNHWRQLLPRPMIEVSYESLVTNPEFEARRIVEACGLEWHPRCLDFQRTPRAVQTASCWQVRQPIHQRSVGRWRNYERHLGPMIDAYRARKAAPRLTLPTRRLGLASDEGALPLAPADPMSSHMGGAHG